MATKQGHTLCQKYVAIIWADIEILVWMGIFAACSINKRLLLPLENMIYYLQHCNVIFIVLTMHSDTVTHFTIIKQNGSSCNLYIDLDHISILITVLFIVQLYHLMILTLNGNALI